MTLPAALDTLDTYRQFITYELVPTEGKKFDKIPSDWRTGKVGINAHDPAFHTDYATAAATGRHVAFVLREDDPFFCLDVDSCLQTDGKWHPLVDWLLKMLPGAACEISQSGYGLHFWGVYSSLLPHGCVNGHLAPGVKLELYTSARFIALGKIDPAPTGSISTDCTAGLAQLVMQHFPVKAGGSLDDELTTQPVPEWDGPKDDGELIRRACASSSAAAAFGDKARFVDLWECNVEVLSKAYPADPNSKSGFPYDASSADAALAMHLRFWTGGHGTRIAELMKRSGLYREKYEREDYLPRTVARVCALGEKVCVDKPNAAIQTETDSEWPNPIELTAVPLPPWPADVFPDDLQAFVNDLARSTATPPEMAALLTLGAVAASAQGKYRICIQANYSEPVNIWVCVALPPSNRKSAVQTVAMEPLTCWESAQEESLRPTIQRLKSENAIRQGRIETFKKSASRKDGQELHQLISQIQAMEAQLKDIPNIPKIWTQDVTTEKLGMVMAANNGRIASMSDEGGIFDIMAGRYSKGVPNLDVYLQGHAGSPIKVDRASRESILMREPALTVSISPQPDVLRKLSDTPEFKGRGLLGRFLYALPTSPVGYRSLDVPPLQPVHRERYHQVITTLLNLQPMQPHLLRLGQDAYNSWADFWRRVETDMREGSKFSHMSDWAGKLPGAVARIAALLHVSRLALGDPQQHEVGLSDMQAAIRMAEVLSVHALAVFDLMEADPALDGARRVLQWILRKEKSEFTFRDCHHDHKSVFRRAAELEPAIDVLIERFYIRPKEIQVTGRPSRWFEVNPAVFEHGGS